MKYLGILKYAFLSFALMFLLVFSLEPSFANSQCTTILSQKSDLQEAKPFRSWLKKAYTILRNIRTRETPVQQKPTWDLGIFESDLTHTGRYLGSGAESTATVVEVNGKEYAYIRGLFTHAETGREDVLSKLTKEEITAVSGITYQEALELQRDSIYWGAYKDIKKLEVAQVHSAEVILNAAYLHSLEGTLYNGKPISPKIHSIVRNHQGIVVGQLMELIHGTPLQKLIYAQSDLTTVQWLSILKQIEEQIAVLHEQGKYHGDLAGSNILIRFENGEPIVQLIDFRPTVFTNAQDDLGILDLWRAVEPEQVISR